MPRTVRAIPDGIRMCPPNKCPTRKDVLDTALTAISIGDAGCSAQSARNAQFEHGMTSDRSKIPNAGEEV